MGKGDFSVKATFDEPKQPYNHPHPYGVFIGGKGLDGDAPQALYCAAFRSGNYIVRGFSGGKPFGIVQKPTPNDAVAKGAADAPVKQEVALRVSRRQGGMHGQRDVGLERHESGRHRRRQAGFDRRHHRHSRQPQLGRDGPRVRGRQVSGQTIHPIAAGRDAGRYPGRHIGSVLAKRAPRPVPSLCAVMWPPCNSTK